MGSALCYAEMLHFRFQSFGGERDIKREIKAAPAKQGNISEKMWQNYKCGKQEIRKNIKLVFYDADPAVVRCKLEKSFSEMYRPSSCSCSCSCCSSVQFPNQNGSTFSPRYKDFLPKKNWIFSTFEVCICTLHHL